MTSPSRAFPLFAGVVVLSTACAVGPDYEAPTPPAPDRLRIEGAAPDFDRSREPEVEWWSSLGDPVLTDLIERARAENLTLEASAARLEATRSLLGVVQKDRFPTGDLRASVEEREIQGESDTYYAAGVGASWELDLFGRVRRSIESATALYEVRLNDHRAAFVAVTAEIGRTYFALRGHQAGIAVARKNIRNEEEGLEIVEAQRDAGRVTDLEVAQTRERLETIRATLPDLEAQELAARHRLAVLVAQAPDALYETLAPTRSMPAVPDRIAVGDPEGLLDRRPDVVAAERLLASATAEIGVAKADLFPRISLGASFDSLATDFDDLGASESNTTSFGPFLTWPLFDLGRIRDRVRAAEAESRASLADYEATVLRALEQTENALVRLDRYRKRQVHRILAEGAAREALELARQRYEAGLTDFLTVLDAEDRHLAAEDAVIRGATDIGTAYIGVYEELGGSWTADG